IHQSVAHCLIQLITILRSYLSNNAPPCGPDSDSSAVFDSGLPATSPYAMLVSEDERAYAVASRLLDILESEETVNAILDHLTNSDTVTTSIAVNCIEVLIALMDKRRPETSFPVSNGDGVGGSGGTGMEFGPFFGGNLFGGGFSSSGPNEPLSGSGPNRLGTKSDLADKARIARACTNLANAVRPRLGQLHTLLQTYHPVSRLLFILVSGKYLSIMFMHKLTVWLHVKSSRPICNLNKVVRRRMPIDANISYRPVSIN
ncbi:hypothetical protein PHET_09919, partial [Paragonimus heterotremus]